MPNKNIGGPIYPARSGKSNGGAVLEDRREPAHVTTKKMTPTKKKSSSNTWRLYIIVWAIVIGGVALTFINNSTIQFVGASIWLVGVALQLIFGIYFIFKYNRPKNNSR
jgi:nucleoside permease NupC